MYATKRIEKECSPDLMARFREEWYATRTYKALALRKRREESTLEDYKRPGGSQYFQKPLQVRKAIRKTQATQRLDGF